MSILEIVALIVAVFVSAATFVPYLRTDLWWIRIFDFPRMQLLVIGIVTLVLLIIRLDMREMVMTALLVVLIVALAIQSWFIFPYTAMACEQVKAAGDSDGVIGVFVANVLQENRDAAILEQEIDGSAPDIILLTEADAWWTARMTHLEQSHPHTVLHLQDNSYGMNLYSRFPLSTSEVRFLIDPAIPSIRTMIRLPNGRSVHFYGVHPAQPEQNTPNRTNGRTATTVMQNWWCWQGK
jgi:endonuclease/exonuclease/phosphatase (EEP) superfamily protein YafD